MTTIATESELRPFLLHGDTGRFISAYIIDTVALFVASTFLTKPSATSQRGDVPSEQAPAVGAGPARLAYLRSLAASSRVVDYEESTAERREREAIMRSMQPPQLQVMNEIVGDE
jgi:hypothetical protein